jgi:hypothetical protein
LKSDAGPDKELVGLNPVLVALVASLTLCSWLERAAAHVSIDLSLLAIRYPGDGKLPTPIALRIR